MNTNPQATTVLCYGDSNTYGAKPDKSGRYAANERWTGLLQKQLGEDYYVIEEGLGGRTTDLEHPDTSKPTRNGIVYFKACIDSHMPLDVILIMLGTNDLKTVYDRSTEAIANALRPYIEYVRSYCKEKDEIVPKIILVSPSYLNEKALSFYDRNPGQTSWDEVSAQKSRQLGEEIKKVANELGCLFFDSAEVAKAGEDGAHLDKEAHQNLARSLDKLISEAK